MKLATARGLHQPIILMSEEEMSLWDKRKPDEDDSSTYVPPTQTPPAPQMEEAEMVEGEAAVLENPKTPELKHRLPIRTNPDYDAEFTLPRDLTLDEVKRITKWLEALAVPGPGTPPMPRSPSFPPPSPK